MKNPFIESLQTFFFSFSFLQTSLIFHKPFKRSYFGIYKTCPNIKIVPIKVLKIFQRISGEKELILMYSINVEFEKII